MKNSNFQDKKRVVSVFEEVLDAPPSEREKLLISRCGEDKSFRSEVERMLLLADSLDDFMEKPLVNEAFNIYENYVSDNLLGQKIGKFTLKSTIGRGGMGTVFLGERDDDVEQQVAVKIISPQAKSKSDKKNFRRECQILAQLEHPAISRLLDAGTTEGKIPYLVMEYVEGVSLSEYCVNKKLSLVNRLNLFLEVCEAVKFAHQNLIIHRDLKPSNILVTEDGFPKLLDFGIAKMLHHKPFEAIAESTLTTKILTPNYASPEQLKGETITTASDVYSLGVILYEMLTGKRPHELKNKSLPEILRTISQETPEKPHLRSRLQTSDVSIPDEQKGSISVPDPKLLKGDLDTIILKSLEKDVKDRYQTVEQLTDDINRYRNDLPILAKPPSNIYKFKKFVSRNRLSFVLSCIALFLGISLLAFSVWSAQTSANQAKENLWRAYASDMNLAMQSYETANIINVRKTLARYKDYDARGWEYNFLSNLANPKSKIATLKHKSEVWNVAFSPDGTRLATACADGFARVYQVPSGKLLITTAAKEKNVWKVVFSPNGKFLATASGDSNSTSVKIWDGSTGKEIRSLIGHTDRVRAIDYSPDGKTIATGSRDGTIRLWNAKNGEEIRKIALPKVRNKETETHDVAFSPDGMKLLSGHGHYAAVYELESDKFAFLKKGVASYLAVAFSPDGKRFALGQRESKIEVYNSETLKPELSIAAHKANINDIAFSPDGKIIASASSDRTVRFVDAENGLELTTLRLHASDVWSVAFSPDSKYFASGSTDFDTCLFDRSEFMSSSSFGAQIGFSRQLSAISPDGQLIASADGTGTEPLNVIYEVKTRRQKSIFSKEIIDVGTFSPDNAFLAAITREGNLVIWNVDDGIEFLRFKAHVSPGGGLKAGRTIAYSPDGKYIISGGSDKSVKLWNSETGALVRDIYKFKGYVNIVGISPDGSRIFAASSDSSALLFDFKSGKVIGDLGKQPKPILSTVFSQDGKTLVTGGADGAIKVWSVDEGKNIKAYPGSAGFIWQLAFSPDGKRLASASGEGILRFWDTESNSQVFAIRTDSAVTNLLAFTPDGRFLVSHGTKERIRLWESIAR